MKQLGAVRRRGRVGGGRGRGGRGGPLVAGAAREGVHGRREGVAAELRPALATARRALAARLPRCAQLALTLTPSPHNRDVCMSPLEWAMSTF